MVADRVLAMVGVESPAATLATALAFRRFVLLEAAVHAWVVVAHGSEPLFARLALVSAIALTPPAACGLVPRLATWTTWAARAAFAVMIVRLVVLFPDAYNHLVLETLFVGAAALTRTGDVAEERLLLGLVRWLVVIVFLWTGLQKVLHGCWFRGEFLALAIATNAHYGDLFALVMPDEVVRLRTLVPLRTGAGPFLVAAAPFWLLSNVVWAAELVLPVLLLVPRTRLAGVIGSVAFLVAVQVVARELVFGVLFTNALLLFTPDAYRRAFPLYVGLLALLLVVEASFPDVWLN
jgi:hypothetical protein